MSVTPTQVSAVLLSLIFWRLYLPVFRAFSEEIILYVVAYLLLYMGGGELSFFQEAILNLLLSISS